MKKFGCLIVAFVLCMTATGCHNGNSPSAESASSQQISEAEQTAVKELVTEFGRQLCEVSINGLDTSAAGDMQKYYGDYVAPSLLEKWEADPSSAPGQITSSFCPDGIHIFSIHRLAEDNYDVSGEILETASAESSGGTSPNKLGIKLSVKKIGGRWMIVDAALDRETSSDNVVYENSKYGFVVTLPSSWKACTVRTEEWQGYSLVPGQEGKITETGPQIFIRHPKWTKENPRQDIPILVFTLQQWDEIQNEQFHIGAAPIGPSELDRNSQYVFALPARYNFASLPGSEEVDDLIRNGAIKATDRIDVS
ncbi:MAG: DUF4878 domain-containing protein [Oscillospiraceae bacterium]